MASPTAALLELAAALTTLTTACVPPGDGGGDVTARDVRGDYNLSFDDEIHLTLNVGGAVRERTATGWGDVIDFGSVDGKPVTLDLGAHCAKPDVDCPSELYWERIAVDQLEVHRNKKLYTLKVHDRRTKAERGSGQVLTGVLDHGKQDAFVIGLGAKADSGGQRGAGCAALAISVAEGRFTRGGMKRADGIAEGRVKLGWLGGCAFGPLLLGATLTVETGYTGTRVGPLSLPEGATGT